MIGGATQALTVRRGVTQLCERTRGRRIIRARGRGGPLWGNTGRISRMIMARWGETGPFAVAVAIMQLLLLLHAGVLVRGGAIVRVALVSVTLAGGNATAGTFDGTAHGFGVRWRGQLGCGSFFRGWCDGRIGHEVWAEIQSRYGECDDLVGLDPKLTDFLKSFEVDHLQILNGETQSINQSKKNRKITNIWTTNSINQSITKELKNKLKNEWKKYWANQSIDQTS